MKFDIKYIKHGAYIPSINRYNKALSTVNVKQHLVKVLDF